MQPGPTSSDRIAANVRAELAARRISQKQMAQALGWSEAKVSRLVSGRGTWDVDDGELVAVRVFGMEDVTPLLAHRVTV